MGTKTPFRHGGGGFDRTKNYYGQVAPEIGVAQAASVYIPELQAYTVQAPTAVVGNAFRFTAFSAKVPVPVAPQLSEAPAVQVVLLVLTGVRVPLSHVFVNPAIEPRTSARKATRFAFVLELLKEAYTIDAKSPMMAITTRSSIKVKPFFLFVFPFINRKS